MSTNIIQEISFLMYAIVMGILITFVYDWIRIFRRVLRHNLFFISFEDLLFWIGCSIAIFLMFYEENNGTLRWFAIIGAALGMGLYKMTLSRFLVHYASRIMQKALRGMKALIKLVLHPLAFLLQKEAKLTRRVYKGMHKKVCGCVRILKKRLTSFAKMVKIMLCKQ